MADNAAPLDREATPVRRGEDRRAVAGWLAAEHGGVVHRAELARYGIDRHGIRNEVAAGRWFRVGRQTIAIGSSELGTVAQWWRAVWESGAGACLDGASALQAAGLTGFTTAIIEVTMPARNRRQRVDGVRLHRVDQLPRVMSAGIPRVVPEAATIRGAQWAVSDRQAALIICMSVQQRLVSGARLALAWRGVRYSARRQFLDALIGDVSDGAHSLGELDFARLARGVGLPPPTRQSIRKGPKGRVYLDVSWDEVGLVVEIDGGHHDLALNPVDDALRQNDRVVAGESVLRIPIIGLRLATQRFMLQVRDGYDARRSG